MLFGQEHVKRYRQTGGAEGHDWQGTTVLILTTRGRRSGSERSTPLIYGKHGDEYLVVASNGGANQPPGWYLNLDADPEVEVQVKDDRFRGPRPYGDSGREAGAVADDGAAVAALRRLSAQDRRARSRSSCSNAPDAARRHPTGRGRRLHFVGIGGAGMSGLALIAQRARRHGDRL